MRGITKITITMSGEQRGELKRMINQLPYYRGDKNIPEPREVKAAWRVLDRYDARREKQRQKTSRAYENAKAVAREAVFLGDSVSDALKKIKTARALAR